MPKNHHLIQAIYGEPWLISIANHQSQINALLQGVFDPNVETEPVEREATQLTGAVAIISISGVLTKERGFCGEPGMQDYGVQIADAIADNDVDAIVLKIYSPGGMVSGTPELSNIIRNSTKPVVAFIEDMACSGAFWLASSCRKIIANNDIATIGSIGVMATYHDLTKANEMRGIKEHLVFAPQSTHKWREHLEVIAGNYSTAQDRLSVIADKFITHIRATRPDIKDEQLTGDVFFAGDVVGSLVDGIGTLSDAVKQALSLSASSKTTQTMKQPKTTAMALAAGVESLEMSGDCISLNAQQVAGIESALINVTQNATALAGAKIDLGLANDTIKQLNTTIAAKDARIAELEAAPGEEHAIANSPIDTQSQTSSDPGIGFMSAMATARKFL